MSERKTRLTVTVDPRLAAYAAALSWYEQFFGRQPSFLPNDIEAVWEVAEHRYVYIVQEPERAGNALVFSFVDDLGIGSPRSPGGASSPPGARRSTAA